MPHPLAIARWASELLEYLPVVYGVDALADCLSVDGRSPPEEQEPGPPRGAAAGEQFAGCVGWARAAAGDSLSH